MKVSNEISESSGGGTGNAENVGPEVKRLPKDAHVMASILRDMGIVEWELSCRGKLDAREVEGGYENR